MKLILRILIRFSFTSVITLLIASYACYRSHKSYWQTIKRVQTVDFNILSHTLPTKLSYSLINNDLLELQRTLDSNYGYFGLVITDCLSIEKICPNQNIIYSTNSQREWKKQLKANSLTENIPYSVLQNPPPLSAEFAYDSARHENPNETGIINQGQVIGRVYYIRGIPPNFREDIKNWWSEFPSNLFNEKNAGKYYGVIFITVLFGGLIAWIALENYCLRNRKERTKLLIDIKESQQKLKGQEKLSANDIKRKDLEITELNQDLRKQQEIVKQKEREKQEIQRNYRQLQIIHSQYKKELEQIINSRENSIQELKEQNTKLESDLELKGQQIKLDKSQIKNYRKIKKTIIDNRNQLNFLTQDLAKYKEKIAIKQNEYIEKESEYQNNIAFLEQEFQEDRQKINSLEQIIKDKNHQLKKLEKERDNLQNQIANLNNINIQKINKLETENRLGIHHISSSNNNLQGSHVISLNITEKDFYEEEIKELLLDILKKTNNLHQNSRREDIILDILEHNPSNNKREEIEQIIKDIFKDYTRMNNKKRRALKDIGFEFIPDGKHYKMRFKGDPRYLIPFSKTPSDKNSGRNIIQDIKKKLF